MKYFFNDVNIEFAEEYEVICLDKDGLVVCEYSLEADDTLGAAIAAEDFFIADHPDRDLGYIRVLKGAQYTEYILQKEER